MEPQLMETETASTQVALSATGEGPVYWFRLEDDSARAIPSHRTKWIVHHDVKEIKLLRLFFP